MLQQCSLEKSAAITDKIIGFTAKDLRPLSIVDGVGFQEMVSCLKINIWSDNIHHVHVLQKVQYTRKMLMFTPVQPQHTPMCNTPWYLENNETYQSVNCFTPQHYHYHRSFWPSSEISPVI